MHILVPSIVDPAAFRGGAGTATRGLLDLLAAEPIGAVAKVMPSPAPRSWLSHGARRVTSLVRSVTSPLPSKALFQKSAAFVASLRQELESGWCDLVLINGTDLLWTADLVPGHIPMVVCVHNIEHELYARQLEATSMPAAIRRMLEGDLRKLKRREIDGLARAAGTIFLSCREADKIKTYLSGAAPLWVPPLFGYPPAQRRHRSAAEGIIELGFLANLDWWPNRDALNWFLKRVLPHCHNRVRLNLFGVGSERYRHVRSVGRHVLGHGYVAELDKVWQTCDIMICPVRTGGGVKIKLAEAIYNGMPVLATPFAVEGLSTPPAAGLAIIDGAEAWVEFLNSTSAPALAAAEIPVWLRKQFCPETHRYAVHRFLMNITDHRVDPGKHP